MASGSFPVGAETKAYGVGKAQRTVEGTGTALNVSGDLKRMSDSIFQYQEQSFKSDLMTERKVLDIGNTQLEAQIFSDIIAPLEKNPYAMDNKQIAKAVDTATKEVTAKLPEKYRGKFTSSVFAPSVITAGKIVLKKDHAIAQDTRDNMTADVMGAETKEEIDAYLSFNDEVDVFNEGQIKVLRQRGYDEVEKRQLATLQVNLAVANSKEELDMFLDKGVESGLVTEAESKMLYDKNIGGVIDKFISSNLDSAMEDITNPSSYLYKIIPDTQRGYWESQIQSKHSSRNNALRFGMTLQIHASTTELQAISDLPISITEKLDRIAGSSVPQQTKEYLKARLEVMQPNDMGVIVDTSSTINAQIEMLEFDKDNPLVYVEKIGKLNQIIEKAVIDRRLDKTSSDSLKTLINMKLAKNVNEINEAYKGKTNPFGFGEDKMSNIINLDPKEILDEDYVNSTIETAFTNTLMFDPQYKEKTKFAYNKWLTSKNPLTNRYNFQETNQDQQAKKLDEIAKAQQKQSSFEMSEVDLNAEIGREKQRVQANRDFFMEGVRFDAGKTKEDIPTTIMKTPEYSFVLKAMQNKYGGGTAEQMDETIKKISKRNGIPYQEVFYQMGKEYNLNEFINKKKSKIDKRASRKLNTADDLDVGIDNKTIEGTMKSITTMAGGI